MKRILLLFFIINTSCFSQSIIKGYIIDKSTNEPLPYATIRLMNTNTYSITNEDGEFAIGTKRDIETDSLEIRFIGFETREINATYFIKNPKLYLLQSVSSLDEVHVIATKKDKDYVYNLLYTIIKKYRNKQSTTESKAFLSLTSSARNVPIEQVEGFYISEQNSAEGIIDLKIKSGRFGQNKSFPFYSLNNTLILKDFQLFNTNDQILPLYPGNMTLSSIKSKYTVKIDECTSCIGEDISISFTPKKLNGRRFYGKILFNKKNLIVKKIDLNIDNPITKGLSSIVENDIITPKKILLNIVFNPLDFEKIQSFDFTFVMDYRSDSSFETITSHSFLYFYDYNNSFQEPYFTNSVEFRNDYDKIIALQASDDFWDSNYQFPKSYNEKRSMRFMKEYGYLINYNNTIPPNYIKYINPSVVSWNKNIRLEWKSIKEKIIEENLQAPNPIRTKGYADQVAHSISETSNAKTHEHRREEFNFTYMLDINQNKFVTRTIYDRNSSFYNGGESVNKLVYVNLIFDIYEYYRQSLEDEITKEMAYSEVKKLCNKKFKEASATIKKMKKATNSGTSFQGLIIWNNKIKNKLNIDNYALIKNNEK